MNFETWKNKVLQALEQIGLDLRLVTNSEPGRILPPNLTDETTTSNVYSYDLITPSNNQEFEEGDEINFRLQISKTTQQNSTEGVRQVPVAYRQGGQTIFDWEEKSEGENFTDIEKDQYGKHPAFDNQHDLNVFLLSHIGIPYVDIFPDNGRLFRYDFSQDQSQLSDLDGNFPGIINVGGEKEVIDSIVGKGWQTNIDTYISIGKPFKDITTPVSVIILVKKLNSTDPVPLITSSESNYSGFELIFRENNIDVQVGNGSGISSNNRRTYQGFPITSNTNYNLIALNIPNATSASISVNGGAFQNLIYDDGAATNIDLTGNFNIGKRSWGESINNFTRPSVYDEAAGYSRLLTNAEVSEIWTKINS